MNKKIAVLLIVVALMLFVTSQSFALDTEFQSNIEWLGGESSNDDAHTSITLYTCNSTGATTYDEYPMIYSHCNGNWSSWFVTFEVDPAATHWKCVIENSNGRFFDTYEILSQVQIDIGGEDDDNQLDEFEEVPDR